MSLAVSTANKLSSKAEAELLADICREARKFYSYPKKKSANAPAIIKIKAISELNLDQRQQHYFNLYWRNKLAAALGLKKIKINWIPKMPRRAKNG